MKPIGENVNSMASSVTANFSALEPGFQYVNQTLNIQNPTFALGSIPQANLKTGVSVADAALTNSVHYLNARKVPGGFQDQVALMSVGKRPVNNFNATSELPSAGNLLYVKKPVGEFNEKGLVLRKNKFELIEFGGTEVLTNPVIDVTDIEAFGIASAKKIVGTSITGQKGFAASANIKPPIPYVITQSVAQGAQGTLPSNVAFQTFTANDFKKSTHPIPLAGTALQHNTRETNVEFNFVSTVNSTALGSALTFPSLPFGPQAYIQAAVYPLVGFVGGGIVPLFATPSPFGAIVQPGPLALPRQIIAAFTKTSLLPGPEQFSLFLEGTSAPTEFESVIIQLTVSNSLDQPSLELPLATSVVSSTFNGTWRLVWDLSGIVTDSQLWENGGTYGIQLR